LSRARRRARGTASVEAAVALPFFILVLSGVWFVRDRQIAIQTVENQARSCAWQYSANNCMKVPAGCETVLLAPGTAPHAATRVDDALNDAKSSVLSGGDSKGVIEKVATEMLGPVIDELFGHFVDASTRRGVTRPGILGGGQTVVGGRYHLACNLRPSKPADVVSDAWNRIVHF